MTLAKETEDGTFYVELEQGTIVYADCMNPRETLVDGVSIRELEAILKAAKEIRDQ